jgi:hypothetical protein
MSLKIATWYTKNETKAAQKEILLKIRCGNRDSKYLFRGEERGNLFAPSTNKLYRVTSACPWCPS